MYDIIYSPKAVEDLKKLHRNEPAAYKKITKKHRLVYRIFETEVYVDVLSAYGHYDDK